MLEFAITIFILSASACVVALTFLVIEITREARK